MLGCITSFHDGIPNPGDKHLFKRSLAIYLLPSHDSRSISRPFFLLRSQLLSVRHSLSPSSGPFYPSLPSRCQCSPGKQRVVLSLSAGAEHIKFLQVTHPFRIAGDQDHLHGLPKEGELTHNSWMFTLLSCFSILFLYLLYLASSHFAVTFFFFFNRLTHTLNAYTWMISRECKYSQCYIIICVGPRGVLSCICDDILFKENKSKKRLTFSSFL